MKSEEWEMLTGMLKKEEQKLEKKKIAEKDRSPEEMGK
jgi:hypothetical protein